METIRIVKRKKGSGSAIWGILLALIILGAIAWFIMDQNVLERAGFGSNEDSIEYDEGRAFDYSNRDSDVDGYMERGQVYAYVSYVNREVIPADSIDSQIAQQALGHLKMALPEVADNTDTGSQGNYNDNRDSMVTDSIYQEESYKNLNFMTASVIETGNELVDIQKNEYSSLSKMGERVDKSLDNLKNSGHENSMELRNFFILSSSLIQEMESERNNNQLTTNRGNYENDK